MTHDPPIAANFMIGSRLKTLHRLVEHGRMMPASRLAVIVMLAAACGNKSKSGEPSTGSGADLAATSADVDTTGTPASMDGDGSGNGLAGGMDGGRLQRSFTGKAAEVVHVRCSSQRLRLTLDGALFDFDHDNLQPGGDDVLAQVKQVGVDPYPHARLIVEGHTDSVGSDEHNDDLSVRRARTVATWLEAHGVDPSRVQFKGYGKRWPRVPNDSDANRAKNRRVELLVQDQTVAETCKPGPPPTGTGIIGEATPAVGPDSLANGGPGNADVANGSGSPPDHPQPGFSYVWNDDDHGGVASNAHSCFTFDPSWITQNAQGVRSAPYDKKDYSPTLGKFIDHCPTDNVIATCDQRPALPRVTVYYQGATDAALATQAKLCTTALGKWTRTTTAGAAPTGTDRGAPAVVCDAHTSPEKKCMEILPTASATAIETYKSGCNAQPEPPRCPKDGATVRCDNKDSTVYWYLGGADNITLLRSQCESDGGKWSNP